MKNSFVSAKKIQRDMIIEKYFDKKSKLDLNTGDVVKLGIKIDEGKNERIQYYEGLIIKGKNSGISETITVRRIVQGIQAAAEQFPYAHILCPHFTRGSLRRMAERSLKRPPVFLSAKEIQHSVDINRVALITMKGIKLVS